MNLNNRINAKLAKKKRATKFPPLTPEQKIEIIELFKAGGDNRTTTIVEKTNCTYWQVSKLIDDFLHKKFV